MKKEKLKVLCKYCADLRPAGFSVDTEVLYDCETCGRGEEITVTVFCEVCKHGLWRATDNYEDGETFSDVPKQAEEDFNNQKEE